MDKEEERLADTGFLQEQTHVSDRQDSKTERQVTRELLDDSQISVFDLHELKMEVDEKKSITAYLGNEKYVKLLQTTSVKHTVGPQGGLLSCPKDEHVIVIPPGALQSETDIEVSCYQVIDSWGLDSLEFVTNVVEVTPHYLHFNKPIKILLRHSLFVKDDSCEVTVLFNSGKPTDNSFASLCQLSSVNETGLASFMTSALWEDFVYIESFRICRFKLKCKGKEYIEVRASLYTPKIAHSQQLNVKLILTSSSSSLNQEKSICIDDVELQFRYSKVVQLNSKEKTALQVTAEIPLEANGWMSKTDSGRCQTISYRDIRNMIVHGLPPIATDFSFVRDETSDFDVTNFAPVFVLNGLRCSPFPISTSDSAAISSSSQEGNAAGKSMTRTVAAIKQDDYLPLSIPSNLGSHYQYIGLDRPVTSIDIEFLARHDRIAKKSLTLGWLLLRDYCKSVSDVRNLVLKDFQGESDFVKVVHIIEEWKQLKNKDATVRALVNICCGESMGGDRRYIEHALMFSSGSDCDFCGVSSDQTAIRVSSASSGVRSTAGETDSTVGNKQLTPILSILSSQDWNYDVFLCHEGEDKEDFVYSLNKELKKKYQIISYFDAVSVREERMAQTEVAEAIMQSPLFVVILSHEFKGKRYPEAEVKAAFEFDEFDSDSLKFDSRYKKIIPVFYKITDDVRSESNVTIFKNLARITGIEKKTDENVSRFVPRVAERIRGHVEGQRDHGEIKILPGIIICSYTDEDLR